ncbi:30S ribosomal protein S17 [Acuticoccus sediminis]|uniref:Small ribosomal subunit protein uS17 n=1 Tax=Acuticoccus sediminis TaxID=2184697 RepID=A0A8B2NZG9_9HYPH|nr:30S ribosomal protein S17 [Acuticoccus sediminis]
MPKRQLEGLVVSAKGDKTIVVTVERRFAHPLLKKTVRRSKKYHAHDESNRYAAGDRVRIEECRPISKTKSWQVVGALTPAGVLIAADAAAQAAAADAVAHGASAEEAERAANDAASHAGDNA